MLSNALLIYSLSDLFTCSFIYSFIHFFTCSLIQILLTTRDVRLVIHLSYQPVCTSEWLSMKTSTSPVANLVPLSRDRIRPRFSRFRCRFTLVFCKTVFR